jgi:hypothetical protein
VTQELAHVAYTVSTRGCGNTTNVLKVVFELLNFDIDPVTSRRRLPKSVRIHGFEQTP